ncbi:MAG: MFS transporter [Pseudonocardiaceae bacterium]|nr:MFS transporter [Pseudonocardiaceae bacterium]
MSPKPPSGAQIGGNDYPRQQVRTRAVLAAVIGNFMEWFDFAVYGVFATNIGRVFFPSENETASLLSSLAVFGVAFFMRPVGGAILGSIGDRLGRRNALSLAIILMTVATTLIALVPSYATIGVAAPVLLVLLRCVQGISTGGEWTSSSAFVVENAPAHRRGLWASSISATAALGTFVGAVAALTVNSTMSEAAVDSWGWRIPFLAAAPLGIVGFYLRRKLTDTPVYEAMREQKRLARSPLRQAGRRNVKLIMLAFAFSSITGVGFYYLATFIVNYLSETVGFDRADALLISIVGLGFYALMCPVMGLLSDVWGRRKPVKLIGCAILVVLSVPAFLLMSQGGVGTFVGLFLLGIGEAMVNVMTVVLLVELFPPETRVTAGAIGYNIGLGYVAGMAPLIAAALVAATGIAVSPAWFLGGIALLSGIVLAIYLPETSKRSLTGNYENTAEPVASEAR